MTTYCAMCTKETEHTTASEMKLCNDCNHTSQLTISEKEFLESEAIDGAVNRARQKEYVGERG